LVAPRGKFASTNQKHFPDLASDTHHQYGISAVTSRRHFTGKLVVALQNVGCLPTLISAWSFPLAGNINETSGHF